MERRQPQDASGAPGARPQDARDGRTRPPRGRTSRWGLGLLLVAVGLGLFLALGSVTQPEDAYLPPLTKGLNSQRGHHDQALYVWGRSIVRAETTPLLPTPARRAL